jgi:adenylate cyclase
MNPDLCTICELMFSKVMKARKITIDATVLFADLRGYTKLSQSISQDAMSGLLDVFYDDCANAIWECDGILNKTTGDCVMAVFNFPMASISASSHMAPEASKTSAMPSEIE